MTEKIARARIFGRVQGVSYRAWTRDAARSRGLDGWVRNCADGSVEAVFAGSGDAVNAMLADCHKGPPAAEVDTVEVSGADAEEAGEGFSIRS